MTHPLHPPVDWSLVQRLGVALFSKNGVELHSVVYYAMARTRLNGSNGLADGGELMAVLIVSQWESFWPNTNAMRARNEMLDWLPPEWARLYGSSFGHQKRCKMYLEQNMR